MFFFFFFFFNDTATTEIYTLSLHDALPICNVQYGLEIHPLAGMTVLTPAAAAVPPGPIPAPPVPASPIPDDLASALGQVATLTQALGSLTSLLQKMQREAP